MSSRYSIYYSRNRNNAPFNSIKFDYSSPDFENKNLEKYSQEYGDVIYIAEQENVGFFHYEHWKRGSLLRRLKYNSDYYWLNADGEPEDWEIKILFSEENLKLTISSYETEMYEQIRSIWERKNIKEGDSFPVIELINLIGGLKNYWNLIDDNNGLMLI